MCIYTYIIHIGEGRWHVFHLPQGPSLLQTNGAGDRRSVISSLVQLSSGVVLKDNSNNANTNNTTTTNNNNNNNTTIMIMIVIMIIIVLVTAIIVIVVITVVITVTIGTIGRPVPAVREERRLQEPALRRRPAAGEHRRGHDHGAGDCKHNCK